MQSNFIKSHKNVFGIVFTGPFKHLDCSNLRNYKHLPVISKAGVYYRLKLYYTLSNGLQSSVETEHKYVGNSSNQRIIFLFELMIKGIHFCLDIALIDQGSKFVFEKT